jgi:predicted CoA-binding protein
MINKSTLVIGASLNEERYSNQAIKMLRDYKHEVFGFGKRGGEVADVLINTDRVYINNLNTVTLYLNPEHQKDVYDYIISLHPRRIIFNPGTENPELVKLANAHGIQTIEACTLVLLKTNQY